MRPKTPKEAEEIFDGLWGNSHWKLDEFTDLIVAAEEAYNKGNKKLSRARLWEAYHSLDYFRELIEFAAADDDLFGGLEKKS